MCSVDQVCEFLVSFALKPFFSGNCQQGKISEHFCTIFLVVLTFTYDSFCQGIAYDVVLVFSVWFNTLIKTF